jgi:hypothetical protein
MQHIPKIQTHISNSVSHRLYCISIAYSVTAHRGGLQEFNRSDWRERIIFEKINFLVLSELSGKALCVVLSPYNIVPFSLAREVK